MPWFRSDVYKEEFFTGMQENETLEKFLDRHVRPDTNFLNKCSRVIDKVVKLIHKHPKYSVNQVIKGGSLGKGTGVRDFSDVDLLVVLNNYKSVEALSENLQQILRDFEDYLVSNVTQNIGDKAMIQIIQRTPYTLQFRMTCDMDCKWFDVDLLPIVDVWSTWLLGLAGGVGSTYSKMEDAYYLRKYYAKCLAKLQIEFIKDRNPRVKDLIRLLKYWKYTENIPLSSYSIELIVIHVWQKQGSLNNFSMKTMITHVVDKLVKYDEISLSWNTNYEPKKWIKKLEKSPPYILDPANPFHDLSTDPSFSWRYMHSGYDSIARKSLELKRKLSDLPDTGWCVIA